MLFIGDLHLGHTKVALLRGFDNVEDHDDYLIEQWRKTVRPNEEVYILGDISSGKEEEEVRALTIISGLPGFKTLIAGNHDSVSGIHRGWSILTPFYNTVFGAIHDYGRIRMNRRMVLMSHYPYLASGDGPGRGHARYSWARVPYMGELLLHAHTHHTDPFSGSVTGREMCVSWDARRGFTTEAQVSKWVESFGEDG